MTAMLRIAGNGGIFLFCSLLICLFPLSQSSIAAGPSDYLGNGISATQELAGWDTHQAIRSNQSRDYIYATTNLKKSGGGYGRSAHLSLQLQEYSSDSDARHDYERRVRITRGNSEYKVLGQDLGIGDKSLFYEHYMMVQRDGTPKGRPAYYVYALQGKWLLRASLYDRLDESFVSDASAKQIVQRVSKNIFANIGPSQEHLPIIEMEEPSDCGKAGELTRYLKKLRDHRSTLAGLEKDVDTLLRDPNLSDTMKAEFGNRLYRHGREFSRTLVDFQRAETRRGLYEELKLISACAFHLNLAISKYHALVGVERDLSTPEERRAVQSEVMRKALELTKMNIASKLESEGLQDIVTSESWDEVLEKSTYHAGRKVDEFIDRETEKIFGLGFHDVRSARRAIQLQMRNEVRRQVAKLLVKITTNEILIEFAAAPIIRWIERDLIPHLREALRNKGNLDARMVRSKQTLERARRILYSLPCTARLSEVENAMGTARGIIHETHFLMGDLRSANRIPAYGEMSDAIGNVQRALFITSNRFLLEKPDYEEELDYVVMEVKKMLAELDRLEPPEEQEKAKPLDLEANSRLAWDYIKGRNGKPRDYDKAFIYIKKGCDGGMIRNCVTLAWMYEKGRGAAKDLSRAAALYRDACKEGNAEGCMNLADMYQYGSGVEKDPVTAGRLYASSCDDGEWKACNRYGRLLEKGLGMNRNPVEAAAYYELACYEDVFKACDRLGVLLAKGDGVAKDYSRAYGLFSKSCDGGYGMGCGNLGVMYARGMHVARDRARAADLYRQACDAGFDEHCGNLGEAYARGWGVPKDNQKAAVLLQKGCDYGREFFCKKLEELKK